MNETEMSNNSEVHTHSELWVLAWDFVYFTLLAAAVWRWFLDFCKICEYLLMPVN